MAAFDHQGLISSLDDDEVFVFGSNKAGAHYGGAAAQAYRDFGAEWGTGEGLTGRSYAFPTLDADMKPLSMRQLAKARTRLYKVAQANSDKTFYLTKVGCGIAAMDEDKIKLLFVNAPLNVVRPSGWGKDN